MGWVSMFTRPMAIGSLKQAAENSNKYRKQQEAIWKELSNDRHISSAHQD